MAAERLAQSQQRNPANLHDTPYKAFNLVVIVITIKPNENETVS